MLDSSAVLVRQHFGVCDFHLLRFFKGRSEYFVVFRAVEVRRLWCYVALTLRKRW